jgi:hypothetical protein
LCDIKLYNEQYSGHLEDPALLGWPDMVVLTGLNTAFDRMLHITAYTRTKNPGVIVVAGGPAVRALPKLSGRVFNYACTGDVEQLQEVIEDAFGTAYVSRSYLENGWAVPRYDLTYWMGTIAYVESSRNCCNNCNFCSLTAEKNKFTPHDLAYLRAQFMALGRQKGIFFLDNNFYCPDRNFMMERYALLSEFRERGFFLRWSAEVSAEFFQKDALLETAKETGCGVLFSGVESFNKKTLYTFNKPQNTIKNQCNMIHECFDAGIAFYYGLMLDIGRRTIDDLEAELDFIFNTPDISLPSYAGLAIPILNTPYFRECLEKKQILPNTKLRDLDATTITVYSQDRLDETARFVSRIQRFTGYKKKMLRHCLSFIGTYKKRISWDTMLLALNNFFLLSFPEVSTAMTDTGRLAGPKRPEWKRTYISTTEPLDRAYVPSFSVDSVYANYFKPTLVTNSRGEVNPEITEDLFRADEVVGGGR